MTATRSLAHICDVAAGPHRCRSAPHQLPLMTAICNRPAVLLCSERGIPTFLFAASLCSSSIFSAILFVPSITSDSFYSCMWQLGVNRYEKDSTPFSYYHKQEPEATALAVSGSCLWDAVLLQYLSFKRHYPLIQWLCDNPLTQEQIAVFLLPQTISLWNKCINL